MVVIKFRQDSFHDGFTEEDSLGIHTELVTVTVDGSHFAVIEVYDLAMFPHQSLFLLLEIFRIDTGCRHLSLLSHRLDDFKPRKDSKLF